MVKHIGTCELETKRIYLRKFRRDDAKMIFHNWTSDHELACYVIWPIHQHIDTTVKILEEWEKSYQNPQIYQWAIVLKETQEVIGSISLFNMVTFFHKSETICELGYCLSRKYWNQGLITEAAYEVLRFAFNRVGFTRVKARHDVINSASGRVLEKLGMHDIGLLKRVCRNAQGGWIDCRVYTIDKDDFLNFKDNNDGSLHPKIKELHRDDTIDNCH